MTTKQNKHIEVVISSLSGLNIMSLESCKEVCNVLKDYFTEVGTTIIKKKEDLEKLVQKKPDLVFSGIKYVGFTKSSLLRDSKNKIWLSEYLDSKGINHTGSQVGALKLEFDKVLAKKEMQKNDIKTSPFFVALPGQYKKDVELPIPFPVFIKPIYEGSGKGVGADSLVTNFEEFEKKVESIYEEFKNPALVEKYLSGREFTVGIFDEGNGKKTAMPVEMIAVADSDGNKILTYKAKKDDDERLVPVEDSREFKRLSTFAKKAFTALGARDYGRIDIRMDGHGDLYFLEANLLPGLNPRKSYFIKTCKRNSEISYENILLRIVEIALKRGA
ncbi:MAG: D-alanine--D-alanine ligase [Patescibacteria group bacterium]